MTKGNKMSISDIVKDRLDKAGQRYWANDNISEYISDDEKWELIDELEDKFRAALSSLIIDQDTDPNSMGTARRLAKMYVNETMSGRYDPQPPVTAFPNDDADSRYGGMIVVRSEIKSMCSHHHQPVSGVAYIGLIPGVKMIGLSKYTRLAQHTARRGTLQEELTQEIADEIQKHTGAKDLAVYIQGTHGCCENRGVMAHSSLTQTCELRGQFFNPSVKNEFLDYIKMQQQFAGNRV
jgi:GTP cyclohydrolase I